MGGLNGNERLIIGIVVLLALLVAWWILRRRPQRVRADTPDVLTPGAAPAERNTLLVDAAPAVAPPAEGIAGGVGEVISAGAARQVDEIAPPLAVAPAVGAPDDLTRIKGLGPKLQTILRDLGVTRFDQIAAWTPEEIAEVDSRLGAFQGRIVRDGWTEQARYLAAGDTAGFEERFGKL